MNFVVIEKKDKYTYVRCKVCGQILITNDSNYSLRKIKGDKLIGISSCKHFEVIENDDRIEIMPK